MRRRIREPRFGRLQLEIDLSLRVVRRQIAEAASVAVIFLVIALGVRWLLGSVETGMMRSLLRVMLGMAWLCCGAGVYGVWTAFRDWIQLRRAG